MILGSGHLGNKEFSRDNLHVSSHLLASLLDNQVAKAVTKLLLEKMFREDLVEEVDEVFHVVVEGKGILCPCDLELLRCSDEAVKFYSLLLDLSGLALMKHKMIAVMVMEYFEEVFRDDGSQGC